LLLCVSSFSQFIALHYSFLMFFYPINSLNIKIYLIKFLVYVTYFKYLVKKKTYFKCRNLILYFKKKKFKMSNVFCLVFGPNTFESLFFKFRYFRRNFLICIKYYVYSWNKQAFHQMHILLYVIFVGYHFLIL